MKRFVSQKMRLIPTPHGDGEHNHLRAHPPKDACRSRTRQEAGPVRKRGALQPNTSRDTKSTSRCNRVATRLFQEPLFLLRVEDGMSRHFEKGAVARVRSHKASGSGPG